MQRLHPASLLFLVCLFAPPAHADSVTIDFENLSDSTIVGSNYASQGVIFTGAVVLSAGISLNDADFPPHSGTNVAVDALGPMTLTFTTPISSFSGFFTYLEPVTITAFGAADQVLGSATSMFAENFVSSGNPPNELLQIGALSSIDSLTIVGDPGGSSFTVDDIAFTQTSSSTVPEPATLALTGGGLIFMVAMRRLARRSASSLASFRIRATPSYFREQAL
jgi:hypothetical protein